MKSKIEEKRLAIDSIDNKIVKLLVDRLNLSKEISSIKKELSLNNYDAKREEKIFESIEKVLKEDDDLDKIEYISSIYGKLLIESKSYQSKSK